MKKIFSKLFIPITVFLTLPFSASAEPAISNAPGTIQHGQSVTVTGTNFGTKISGNPAPLRWETWGDTVGLPADQASGGYWTLYDESTIPYTSDSVQRVPGRLVMDSSMISTGTSSTTSKIFYRNNAGFSATHKTYMNYWIYTDKGAIESSRGGLSQSKHYKLCSDFNSNYGTAGIGTPEYSMSIWEWYNPDSSMIQGTIYADPSGTMPQHNFRGDDNSSYGILKGEGWYNIQIMYDWGAIDTENGSITEYITGPTYTKYGKFATVNKSTIMTPPEFYPGIECSAPGSVMYNGSRYLFKRTSATTCTTPPDQDTVNFALTVTDPFPNAIEFWQWTMKSNYAWQSGYSYITDARVDYGGKAYKCIADISSATTPDLDTSHWVKVYDTVWPAPTIKMYFDSMYIDNSFARVEIGNANTYDACTHREIQIPSAWSDGSITFTSNKGSFSDGQAYLYVVDESGVQNAAGYPITLTSTQDITSPSAPLGLSVM